MQHPPQHLLDGRNEPSSKKGPRCVSPTVNLSPHRRTHPPGSIKNSNVNPLCGHMSNSHTLTHHHHKTVPLPSPHIVTLGDLTKLQIGKSTFLCSRKQLAQACCACCVSSFAAGLWVIQAINEERNSPNSVQGVNRDVTPHSACVVGTCGFAVLCNRRARLRHDYTHRNRPPFRG